MLDSGNKYQQKILLQQATEPDFSTEILDLDFVSRWKFKGWMIAHIPYDEEKAAWCKLGITNCWRGSIQNGTASFLARQSRWF